MAAIKKIKPTTPGQRHRIAPTFEEITTDKPYKPLLEPIKRTGGRNADGRRSMRYIGGGHKRRYRVIDFARQ
jgi:large subunit ribosomal protein L2